MAKYYVQSGTLKMVVQADDAHKAALWAVHKAMQQVLPMYDDDSVSAPQKQERALAQGYMILGDTIELNEIGFSNCSNRQLPTYDVVTEWSKLMVALTKIEKELLAAV